MFGFFKKKKRPSKTFKISYILSSRINDNEVSFDKENMNESYIDCETIGEAASIFTKRFFTSNHSIFIYGIEELSIRS